MYIYIYTQMYRILFVSNMYLYTCRYFSTVGLQLSTAGIYILIHVGCSQLSVYICFSIYLSMVYFIYFHKIYTWMIILCLVLLSTYMFIFIFIQLYDICCGPHSLTSLAHPIGGLRLHAPFSSLFPKPPTVSSTISETIPGVR